MSIENAGLNLPPLPVCHTYSIVARDPATGQLGVAVQSHYFCVGRVVPWAEAGIGAVATQAMVDPSYGPRGLELMRIGTSAPDTLAASIDRDPNRNIRQVAMVDTQGRVAAHTGLSTIAEAGHLIGEGFSVQANMMLRNTVWGAMAQAYGAAQGEFADRLLAALEAAEAEGGDIRGRQSAALLVVKATSSGRPWHDKLFDLRVDDAHEPLLELRRLVEVNRAYDHLRSAQEAFGDRRAMDAEFQQAAQLSGNNPEMYFWHAITLLRCGYIDDGMAILARVVARGVNWRELALRLPAYILPRREELSERIRQLS